MVKNCRRIGSKAGTFAGRDFAFTRNWPSKTLGVGVKSERKHDDPYGFGDPVPNPFPILTNPNKCHIDWYTTEYVKEVPESNDEIFLPSTGYTKFGSYAQYNDIPAGMGQFGWIYTMKSMSQWEHYKGSGVKLLFVDCKKSFGSMVDTSVRIGTGGEILTRGAMNVEHFRKRIINNSPRELI